MVKRRNGEVPKHRLGRGYYRPEAVMERLKSARRRGHKRRIKELTALLREITALPPTSRLTKSWRSIPYRELRVRQMAQMRKTMTLQEIGDHYGVTRERVRQILAQAEQHE